MTLALDTTVAVADRRGPNEQPARIVAPGLAITPSLGTPGRYTLTHIESGKTVLYGIYCAEHIAQAAAMAAACGVDWATPADRFDVVAGRLHADAIRAALGNCLLSCPRDAGEATEPKPADEGRHVRIVAGARFVAAYEGGDLRAVKWHAAGVWYVTDGGAPRTFAEEGPATKAFLVAAEAVPA